jgi:Uncharacterized protein conserved in bacteria
LKKNEHLISVYVISTKKHHTQSFKSYKTNKPEKWFKMTKATWNGAVLAQSNETIILEGNHYFPSDAVNMEFFRKSGFHTTCPWKGVASYYDVFVEGKVNKDAAWYYPEPKGSSAEKVGKNFSNYVAFWKDVDVS